MAEKFPDFPGPASAKYADVADPVRRQALELLDIYLRPSIERRFGEVKTHGEKEIAEAAEETRTALATARTANTFLAGLAAAKIDEGITRLEKNNDYQQGVRSIDHGRG